MSTSITYLKNCLQCQKSFEAKRISTRYCSNSCGCKAYKIALKTTETNKNIPLIKMDKPIAVKIAKDVEVKKLNEIEFLTVKQASQLLNISTKTIYGLINSKILPAVNLTKRNTLLYKVDIIQLFKQSPKDIVECESKTVIQNEKVRQSPDPENFYTTHEIYSLYKLSSSTLYAIIKRHGIETKRFGKYSLINKPQLDYVLKMNHYA